MNERTIVIGDIHGRDVWKRIINKEKCDRVVFMGDYFDSYDLTAQKQMDNFLDIVQYMKTGGKEVVMLMGNHDYHYLPQVMKMGEAYNGFQAGACVSISYLLDENKRNLSMAYEFDNFLFSHAGVGETWLRDNGYNIDNTDTYSYPIGEFVNDVWDYRPNKFGISGKDAYGDSMGETPIWIRPYSLRKDSIKIKNEGIIQIVGHTTVNKIDIKGKSSGGKYFFIDTLGTSGEYLIIDGGVVTSDRI